MAKVCICNNVQFSIPPAVLEEGIEEGIMDGWILRGHATSQGIQVGLDQGKHTRIGRPHLVRERERESSYHAI